MNALTQDEISAKLVAKRCSDHDAWNAEEGACPTCLSDAQDEIKKLCAELYLFDEMVGALETIAEICMTNPQETKRLARVVLAKVKEAQP